MATLSKLTMNQVIDTSGFPAALFRAVVKQHGGWDAFKQSYADIVRHGAAGGVSGFIYYTETSDFFARNRGAILNLLQTMADDTGYSVFSTVVQLCSDSTNEEIAQTLYGSRTEWFTDVSNRLAWMALEQAACAVEYALENQ
jgi:hypothetical protein